MLSPLKVPLLLTSSPTKLLKSSADIFQKVSSLVSHVSNFELFIYLYPNFKNPLPTVTLRNAIASLYCESAPLQGRFNTKIFLDNITSTTQQVIQPIKFSDCSFESVFSDSKDLTKLQTLFSNINNKNLHFIGLSDNGLTAVDSDEHYSVYPSTCMGGTFDRLHAGHKILLTRALLSTSKKLLIGITDDSSSMIKSKTLFELIEPFAERLEKVKDFCTEVRPNLNIELIRLKDPYGPPIRERDFDCIFVSEETARGARKINEKRKNQGMPPLDVEIVDIVKSSSCSSVEKISSTCQRENLLGTLLRHSNLTKDLDILDSTYKNKAFFIGLTGGIACGKSTVSSELSKLGAVIIDFDKLGHEVYLPSGPAYTKLIEEFGSKIVGKDGVIDRKILGSIVFKDASAMKRLTDITWPEMLNLAKRKMIDELEKRMDSSDPVVFVFDAAILFEAGWDAQVHEVWVVCAPENEVISRLVNIRKHSEAEAKRRISSQMSNLERISRANLVISSHRDIPYIHVQVNRAFNDLLERIKCSSSGG